jgi:hypothetical protein
MTTPPSHVEKPGHAVPAAADRDHEVVIAREAHRRYDVVDAGASRDQRGVAVRDRVPYHPGAVVVGVTWDDELAAKGRP